MRTSDVDKKDYHLIVTNPDASFSPQRNQAILDQTIAETETFFKQLGQGIDDELGNRMDIVITYGDYRLNRGGTKTIKEYLGPDGYRKVIGEKLLSKVRVMDSMNRLNGNRKYRRTVII